MHIITVLSKTVVNLSALFVAFQDSLSGNSMDLFLQPWSLQLYGLNFTTGFALSIQMPAIESLLEKNNYPSKSLTSHAMTKFDLTTAVTQNKFTTRQ